MALLFTAAAMPAVGGPLVYAGMVRLLRRAPRGSLRPLLYTRRIHDVTLALYSAMVAAAMATKLTRHDRLDSVQDLVCRSSPGAPILWYASKLLEWADTAFLLAADRGPSRLHLFHHASAPSLVWLNLLGRANPTPCFDVATGLNGLAHTFQYAYYAFPRQLRFLKRRVTQVQLGQHATVLYCILAALFYRARDGPSACDAPPLVYGISLLGYLFFLVEFAWFYAETYVHRGAKLA